MAQGRSFPNDDRQRVLDATDIVRLIGEHVQLKQKGREHVCVCPFHDDHKPSMYVVPAKQIYHCFSCGAGGNALDFAINYFKMDFREALKFLADRAGLELTPWKPAGGAHERGPADEPGLSRAQLFEAAAFAQEFFRTILRHGEHGKAARETVEKRGIAPEMVDEFGIGASPDRWDGLERTIAARKMDPAPFVALGLLKRREQGGGLYDALRHRLIFPIHDQIGRVIGFGGRKMREEDEPKYLNSPESPLFDKGKNLYAMHLARKAIQDSKTAIVTEGYTDVIACHQHGVRNVVATLGTALTRDHARLLERLCDTVVLLFDADEAGQRAADRAIEVFFHAPVDVKICVLPGGKDPDELLKQEGGAERFRAALASAKDALDYRFERLANRADERQGQGRAKVLQEDLQRLVELGITELDPIRFRNVARRLARLSGATEHDVMSAIKQTARFRLRRDVEVKQASPPSPVHVTEPPSTSSFVFRPTDEIRERRVRRKAEAAILGAMLESPGLVREALIAVIDKEDCHLERGLQHSDFVDPRHRDLFAAIVSLFEEVESDRLLSNIEPSELRVYASALHSDLLKKTDAVPLAVRRVFYACLTTIAHAMMGESVREIRHSNALSGEDYKWLESIRKRRVAMDPNRHMFRSDNSIASKADDPKQNDTARPSAATG